jgi:beta-lactamase regulating signal transducer with metallopeptidase domain
MTAPVLFSGPFFSPLGWALFHFLWQGTLVAALLATSSWILRKRTPALRYCLACGALATMLAFPIATAWSLATRGARHPSPESATYVPSGGSISLSEAAPAVAGSFLTATLWNRLENFRPWALSVWFAGVLFLSVRFLGGLAAARRLTRRGTRPAPAVWQEALARLASRLSISRPVRLLESAVVRVPTAIGAFRPVILFPATVFLGLPTRGLEALLAHELAHVRRHDYFVNLLQTVVETLLFYHPAVWWVSSRVRTEREHSSDDLAIAATGDARTYARALMRLEEMRGSAPALAVAAGGGNLWKRVLRLLTQTPAVERPSGWLAGAVALAMIVILGAAAQVRPSGEWDDGHDTPSLSTVEPPDAVVRPPETPDPGSEVADTPTPTDPDEENSVDQKVDPEDEAEASDVSSVTEAQEPTPVEKERRALTAEELVEFRNHGVTSDFVRSIAALGYSTAEPDDILSLKIHGVTAEDIAEMNRLFGKRSLEDHVSFKIHGVTPESVRSLSALGHGKLSSDDVLSMKIHGVDAAYVERLRAGGYRQVSAEDAVSAKIHGVSPGDAEAWNRLGYANVSLDDLVGARIHGASPEFAAEVRSLGFSNISLEDVVAFRIHGVTDDFLRAMKALGFSPPAFSADDAVAFRIHGVTPEFVREIRSLGYTDASADDLAALRIHGISSEEIRKANSRAGRRVSLEDLVDRETCGKETEDED